MRRATVAMSAAVVMLSAGVFAQGRSFEGKWVLDSEKMTATATAGGGGGGGGAVMSSGGSGGVVTARSTSGGGGGGGVAMAGGAGGSGGGIVRIDGNPGIAITLDAKTFAIDANGTKTTYNLDGSPTTVQVRGADATASAKWDGDSIVIDVVAQSGTTHTKYSIEGSDLVRETTRGTGTASKTYFKKG